MVKLQKHKLLIDHLKDKLVDQLHKVDHVKINEQNVEQLLMDNLNKKTRII